MKPQSTNLLPAILVIAVLVLGGCALDGGESDIVGLWHFNEGTGQAVIDSSGTGWDLFLGADATVEAVDPAWTTAGRFGHGLSFTAAESDYVSGPGQTGFAVTNKITVEFWIKTTSTNVSHPIKVDPMLVSAQLEGTGILGVTVGNGTMWGAFRSTTTPINNDQWHYIAIVYDGDLDSGTLDLYVDGVLEMSEHPYNITIGDSSALYIGGRPSNVFLNGYMDEVRVSKSARTAAEIAANY